MAEASVGAGNLFRQAIYRVGRQSIILERDAVWLNCYTNVDRKKGRYKPSLIVFYYVNRKRMIVI
jgi:hypothetical protein